MVSMIELTRQLSNARKVCAFSYAEWIKTGKKEFSDKFDELLIEINSLKVKIENLKAKS